MRSLFALLFVGIATSAMAADLPAQPSYKAPAIVPAPGFTWTGVYVGANAGYGFGDNDLRGAVAGGQVGANWQTGPLVLGVEGDFQWSGQQRTVGGVVLGIPVSAKAEVPWVATARGRVGLAYERALFYVTGGAAWVDLKASATALGITVSAEDNTTAWVVGGGVEWMFVDRWSVKAEYLYLDTGNTTLTVAGVAAAGRFKDNIARVGVNYHF